MAKTDEIEAALSGAFAPSTLEVINESAQHAGHAGDDGSGESHFRVRIKAAAFAGVSRIERHRMVHKALGAPLIGDIHALALEISD